MMLPSTKSLPHTGATSTSLALIWVLWLGVVLVLALANPALGETPQVIGEVAVLVHMTATLLVVAKSLPPRVALVIGASLILRVILVFWDLHFRGVLLLPNSGDDTEMFYYWSLEVAKNPAMITEDFQGGAFSKLFGLLLWLIGPLRAFAQYTNALFGLTIVLLFVKTTRWFGLESRDSFAIVAVAALLPNTLVLSAIFLRESVIALLVAISLYFFLRWFRGGHPFNVVLFTASVLTASTFHAGVIGIGIGYMIVALFYRRSTSQFGIGMHTAVYLALFAVVMYFVVAQHPDLFLGKFERYGTEDAVFAATNRRDGGSAYLTGLTIESYGDLLRYGPLRAAYFLGSPLPWHFRGFVDVLTFFTDSLFYIGVPITLFIVHRRLGTRQRLLAYGLFIVIFVAALMFGAGVSNAGTAVRHRFKLFPLFLALGALTFSKVEGALLAVREGRCQRGHERIGAR